MSYSSWISKFHTCVFVVFSFVICAQSDVPRPRGVSLSKASLYPPDKDFTCFDGTITIPFSYVNDDYCDCFDGSDEPGTSACLNGVFHCANAGHRPQNIPSSRVNDGVCDCCDGTDEYTTPDACRNICEELGREARAEAQRLAELHKAGSQVRIELIEKGNRKRSDMAEQLAQLEKDKADAEKIKAEKESLKSELEAKENEALKVYREAEEEERQKKAEEERQTHMKEATEHFERFDSNNDGVLTKDEIQVVNVFDKDKDGQVDEEEFKYFLNDHESVDKETFITTTWPLLKPLMMMEQGMFKPAEDPAEDHELEHDPEEEIDDVGKEIDEELDTDDEHGDTELPSDDIEDHDEPQQAQTYDDETQKLVEEASEARRQLTDAERTVREIESNIRNIKENLEKDYGLNQEFATLDGECFEYEDKEYVYKICLFQKVTQKSKNGGSEIGLGNWGEWAGDENNKYSAMKYTNGVSCWNGPSRSTTVQIQCGLETQLLSVTEPFRCEYRMELSTPAACDDTHTHQQSSHDEL
ncbi:glucosidase 2 subunit beta [Pectinophora gossypiella]|uniref:Glucosidase 2 subunit beta n=1 Tax=Pectinophora gossypiella TaxID=13191 RepID=A0A1E1WUQ0_PECGO|nr:glucosidase 2 subunit beta [Pectinophora gossypiella]